FRPSQDDGRIKVACILAHVDGHREESTLSSSADVSGNKNSIQAVGSAVTYLQRYTLKMALGLAAAVDDDGIASGSADNTGELISAQQVADLRKLITDTGGDIQKFCKYAKINDIGDIAAAKYEAALAAVKQAAETRKAAKT